MRNPNLSQHPYPVKLRELMEKKEIKNEFEKICYSDGPETIQYKNYK